MSDRDLSVYISRFRQFCESCYRPGYKSWSDCSCFTKFFEYQSNTFSSEGDNNEKGKLETGWDFTMKNIFGLFRNNTFKPREKDADGNTRKFGGVNYHGLGVNGFRNNNNHASGRTKEYEKDLDVITNKLGETPAAVDALLFILNQILQNPRNQKFKQINVTKKAFINNVGKSGVWGTRFLTAIGFIESPTKEYLNLIKRNEDPAKLLIAKQKLEQVQQSEIYNLSKEKISFNKEVDKMLDQSDIEENNKKQEYLEKIPRQPQEGAAGSTKVRVYFGSEDISRVFASDDTLQSVLYWLAASLNSKIIDNLENGRFELIDRTNYPPKRIEVTLKNLEDDQSAENDEGSALDLLAVLDNRQAKKRVEDNTLQSLDLWPSGELEVQKAGFLLRERALNGVKEE